MHLLKKIAKSDYGLDFTCAVNDNNIFGVQFHPVSVLTEGGLQLLANWLTVCGDPNATKRAVGLSPVIGR